VAKNSEATLLLRIKSVGDSILGKTKSALSDIKTWAAAAFAAMTSGAAVSAFKEAEKATNALNQSLITQGIYTKSLSEDYSRMASELQAKTTFDDDAIKAAQAQMQNYLGQTKITKELMQATLDLAAAKKIDLASAADIVGKSIGTNTNVLKRHGVEVADNASKSEKYAQVIAGLNQKFGGQAAAAAQGLGSIDQMKNVIGDLLETVGERFAPFITMAAQGISRLSQDIMNNKLVWDILDLSLEIVSKSFISLKMVLGLAGDFIIGTLSTIAEALIAFATADFARAVEILNHGFDQTTKSMAQRYMQFESEWDAITAIRANKDQAAADEEVRRKKETEDRKRQIVMSAQEAEQKFLEARSEKEIQKAMVDQKLMSDQHLMALNWRLYAESDHTKKLELEMEKRKYLDEKYKEAEAENQKTSQKIMRALGIEKQEEFRATMDNMSNMQNSKNKILQTAGKAAALANITMNTADAATGAYRAMVGIPVVGPGLAVTAATATVAYGAEQAANVAGIQLAEGGVIKATPGGVHAIIGEGGRDEVVVPLENGRGIGGTKITLIAEGGFLGDSTQAKEFALAVDRELFKLRQSNESLAFDRGVI
jgi:hypothetical protein